MLACSLVKTHNTHYDIPDKASYKESYNLLFKALDGFEFKKQSLLRPTNTKAFKLILRLMLSTHLIIY